MTEMQHMFDNSIKLRPEEAADETFLFRVYASTREEELRVTGWPPEVLNSFVVVQFRAMRQGYCSMFPQASFSIILLNQEPIGRIVVDRGESALNLVDIALLAPWRSKGIGSFLIGQLLTEAGALGKSVSLNVLRNNRAAQLYQKLGFRFVENSGIYDRMCWMKEGCIP